MEIKNTMRGTKKSEKNSLISRDVGNQNKNQRHQTMEKEIFSSDSYPFQQLMTETKTLNS